MKAVTKGRVTHLENHNTPGFVRCGERVYDDMVVISVKDTTCYYCKLAWEKSTDSRL